MNGLSWHLKSDDHCMVWLFESAVMDTPGKLVLGLFGCFALGSFQGLLLKTAGILRKKQRRERGILNLITYSLCYCILLVNGYLLMFLAMSGWIPMLLMTVLGIVVGHILVSEIYAKRTGASETPLLQEKSAMCSDVGEDYMLEQGQPCGC